MSKRTRQPANGTTTSGVASLPRMAGQLWLDFYLGRLSAGERLPSVRTIARQLGISPTTVLEFYQSLQAEGVVEGRPRSGVFLRRLGVQAERRARDVALFALVNQTAHRLQGLGVQPGRFIELLRMRTGHAHRPEMKFGFLSYRESFDLLHDQIQHRLGFGVPIVPLLANSADTTAVAAHLRADRTIRCILTTYLYSKPALALARQFGLDVIVIRLKPSASEALSPPATGRRYILTRDREVADGFRRLICSVCLREQTPSACGLTHDELHDTATRPAISTCRRVVVASLDDEAALACIEDDAQEIYATRTALRQAHVRCGGKCIRELPTDVADDTVDDILFHYLLGGAVSASG